jgi:hypothetical protein
MVKGVKAEVYIRNSPCEKLAGPKHRATRTGQENSLPCQALDLSSLHNRAPDLSVCLSDRLSFPLGEGINIV